MSMTIDTADGAGAETPTVSPAEPARRRRRIVLRKAAPMPPADGVTLPNKRRGLRRKWVAAGLAVVLAAGGGTAWGLTRGGSGTAAPTSRTITETISTGTVSQSVQASGTIAAANVADLAFPSAGTVNSVKVTIGEKVTKGQALASIDTTSLQLAVNAAQASYNQSAAQLSSAEANLAADRAALAALRATPTTSTSSSATGSTGSTAGTSSTTSAADLATQEQNEQAQIDSANAQIAADESSLAGAQDKLNSAKAALAGATITAPISGVVSAVNVFVGDAVSGNGSSGAGGSGGGRSGSTGASSVSSSATSSSTAAVEVVDMTGWVVNATVSGADLDSIKTGQQAQITPNGARQPVFGTVASVGVTATTTSGGAAEFPVTINVTGNPAGLHPGDSANVAIITQQLNDVLTVPTAALTQNSSGQTVVTKLVNGQPQVTPVAVGNSYGAQTIVTSGLSDGDQIQFTITNPAAGRSATRAGGTGTGNRTGGTGTGNRTGGFGGGGFGGFGGGGGGFGGGGFGGGAG
jgi:multidrug efflux pump subunit AcrA (membrane-fusion protein)